MTFPARITLPTGIASPDGCILCGNTIEVRGYDCWACESAYNAPVADTSGLAETLAVALAKQIASEGAAA